MAVSVPAAENLHTASQGGANRYNIGSPGTGTKSAGNLPLTSNATQLNVGLGTNEGYVMNFVTPATYDVSSETRLLVCSVQFNAPNRIQFETMANGGYIVRLQYGPSGNTHYRSFVLAGSDSVAGSAQPGSMPFVIDLNATADHADDPADAGTPDNTDVIGWGPDVSAISMQASSSHLSFFARMHIFETAKNATNIVQFTGTSDFDDIITAILGTDYTDRIGAWVSRLGNSYVIPVAFQIGDTSTATNFDCVGKTINFPANADATDPRYRYTLQAGRVYIDLRDNVADDADLDDSTWVWGVASPFDFDVNNNSAITIEGAVFGGMGDFTLGSSVTGGATFNLNTGSDVIISGANIDGSTINGDATLDVDTDFDGVTINGDLDITIAADTVLDWTGVTITGDVSNSAGSNTLTINIDANSSVTASDAGTGNGQTNIVQVAPITITVTDLDAVAIENARVLVTATETVGTITDGDTILTGLTSALGVIEDATFNYEAAFDPSGLDIAIRVRQSSVSPYKKTSELTGTITTAGFTRTVPMLSDE